MAVTVASAIRGRALLALTLGCFATLLTSCSGIPVQGSSETIHYVVFGFGVVSVPRPGKEDTAAQVVKARSLGITMSNQPGTRFNAGYAASTVILIPDDAEDVRVEVMSGVASPLIVDAKAARLEKRRKKSAEGKKQ